MSTSERPRRQTRSSRGRRDAIGRIVLLVVGLALVFLLGAAFARTLDNRPKPGRTETVVRTLTPLPQDAPARTVTVTVTVTGP
jgi:hypothetical protein